ncbi:uncharacterized protein LOC110734170 [Chenopodium quinoa]|nr:uncharacterized protein LOC110734170 [Chenopodium quinoa]
MNKSSSSPSSSSTSTTSSSLTTMKVKTLIHNLIFSHICRVIRALSKAKSIFLEIFRENQLMYLKQTKKKNKYRKKILFGSFRLHYNWCSSSAHVLPIPSPTILEGVNTPTSHIYYDSTWNSVYSTDNETRDLHKEGDDQVCKSNGNKIHEEEGQLSSYLQWLEEKGGKNEKLNEGELENVENEIDKLADLFIANCHEKFRLEKIESYRRYQELLARTL